MEWRRGEESREVERRSKREVLRGEVDARTIMDYRPRGAVIGNRIPVRVKIHQVFLPSVGPSS